MDLLKTILVYMSMVFAASVQNAPDPAALPAYNEPTPTPYVEVVVTATPSPTPSPKPTPVPTIDISPNPDYKTIQVGDSGDQVLELQEKLKQYGYYEGDIDGKFGNQTRRAVEAFQYQHGLSVDGIAGRNTLTVLYESDEVRMAPNAVTPEPETTLKAAITEAPTQDATFMPVETVEPEAQKSDAGEETAAPTDTPAPAQTAAPTDTPVPTQTAVPTDTPAPTQTIAPTDTPAPVFSAIEGSTICVDGVEEPLTIQPEDKDAEPVALQAYDYDGEMYLPLLSILKAAAVNVISSVDINMDEYAFVIGDDIFRIAFTEDQAGLPVNLEAFKNNEAQILPVRDIRREGDVLYLPASTLESLIGLVAETNEETGVVTVRFVEETAEE